MKIDGDEEAMNLLNNMKGSIENKIRAVYNLGYQRGYKVGRNDSVQFLERALMDMTEYRAEQTEPKEKCPFDDPIPCEWINCPKQTDCAWK